MSRQRIYATVKDLFFLCTKGYQEQPKRASLCSMLNLGVPFAYVHNLNPFVLQLTESFGIRWYALAYLAGFYATYRIVRCLAARKLSPLSVDMAGDFVFTAALGTIIGGRIGYCIFYSPELLTQLTSAPPFWGLLAINRGGMASHGGIIGIMCACIYFARTRHLPALHLIDLAAMSGTIGVFFGRIANFINGELVGRPAPEWLPWAVKFPQDIYLWSNAKLSALSEIVGNLGIKAGQWRQWLEGSPFDPTAQHNIESTLSQIIAKIQAGDLIIKSEIAPLLVARHPSQLYEAFGEGFLLFSALFLLWRKPRKPGFISAWFLILYAIVRIVGEQFRMPDPQIGFQIFGTTRGQLLSAAMLLAGILCLFLWNRRDSVRLGGWKGALRSAQR